MADYDVETAANMLALMELDDGDKFGERAWKGPSRTARCCSSMAASSDPMVAESRLLPPRTPRSIGTRGELRTRASRAPGSRAQLVEPVKELVARDRLLRVLDDPLCLRANHLDELRWIFEMPAALSHLFDQLRGDVFPLLERQLEDLLEKVVAAGLVHRAEDIG